MGIRLQYELPHRDVDIKLVASAPHRGTALPHLSFLLLSASFGAPSHVHAAKAFRRAS